MHQTVRVSILSPSRLFAEALALRMAADGRLECVAVTDRVDEAVAKHSGKAVQVVLVDCADDVDVAEQRVWELAGRADSPRIVVVGVESEPATIARLIEAGAGGYVERDAHFDKLTDVVLALVDGRATCSPQVLARVMRKLEKLTRVSRDVATVGPSVTTESLSQREIEVARLVAAGLLNKQIARRLGITLTTVKNHVHQVLTKWKLSRRRDVLSRARQLGWNEEIWAFASAGGER
ncbi:MAG: response regulator transcription factor [Pirellulales bacterium]|nr:response regulator transcription factor [Pirellulales bacterium]